MRPDEADSRFEKLTKAHDRVSFSSVISFLTPGVAVV
jgi:hypothetical protein